ncbi:DNA polymerase III subunit delta [Latilactobacillus sakei]|uniref:DNA polymerase III subunit delta n=1 Tax=Latilactobacillus sakei TaxID=1599 RepID=UPI000468FDF3|nr:DNA polymerase III subunit delta [Latilactobacillus sakei]ARJ71292.1 DNA polymerase III subunit delta [Latilactobacillus sakei]AWZ45467.1 DNA polymerase III subunit delta [Latilactobacillus sakei]KRK72404.1 holA protein [Latilactobacillus sakei subsp. sakei DSM 20017 = JCM 1157]MCE8500995.1 DNA polymerase III subunit delta [Latilactobacillus sakei]MDG9752215.1 DNA polymerase III subunit delta [Latilactobacillus sakei]
MTIEQLQKELQQNQLATIYLVLGQESALIEKARQLFKHYLPEEERTMNFASYDLATTDVANALDDAESAPFFGERRIVFMQNPYFLTGEKVKNKLDQDLVRFQAYLEKPQPTTSVVLFAPYPKLDERKKIVKQLKKVASLVSVEKVNERQVQQLVTAELKQQGMQIDSEALALLISKTNSDYSQIMAELPKLMLYAQQTKQITTGAVAELVSSSIEDNVFSLVPLVLQKKVGPVLTMYHELLLQKEEPLKINAILIGQFRLLLQVKILFEKGYSQGNLASVLKIHPYRIKLAMQQIKHFSKQTLAQAYLGLEEIEVKIKTGQGQPELLFELFMLQFAAKKVA